MPSAQMSSVSSAEPKNPTVSSTLPQDVISCLKNQRFLHLATCRNSAPHTSLMNYTYLPSTPFPSQDLSTSSSSTPPSPTIIMTTDPSSRTTSNMISNPNVSLLVHDWSSHRLATLNLSAASGDREGSPPPRAQASPLASWLFGLNTAAQGRISVTLNGKARVLEPGGEEEAWCRERHVENHQFDETHGQSGEIEAEDGGTECFVEGENVKVVVVRITDGRIADWQGGTKDFVIGDDDQDVSVNGAG